MSRCPRWIGVVTTTALLGCWESNPDFMPAADSTTASPLTSTGDGPLQTSTSDAGSTEAADTVVETASESTSSDGPSCPPDAQEPNDDEARATPLMDPVVAGPLIQQTATLESPVAEDWYTFEISPPDGMVPNLRVSAVSEAEPPAGAPDLVLDVCMFFECLDSPNTDASCTAMLPTTTSPEGRVGCCRDSAERATWNCGPGVPRNVRVYLAVSADTASCGEYQLEYLVSE